VAYSDIQADQEQLLQRIDYLVHVIKTDLRYTGSKDTADFSGAIKERLLGTEQLRHTFNHAPSRLLGLLRTLVRHEVFDEMRARRARKRQAPSAFVLQAELCPTPDGLAGRTPSTQRALERKRDLERILYELDRFARGDDDSRIGPRQRATMVRALELSLQGMTQREIAEALGVPKSTVAHRIDALRALIARRVALAERASQPAGVCAPPAPRQR
jgi:DNA-directed RNA polymerase specialized sigma24 family protein